MKITGIEETRVAIPWRRPIDRPREPPSIWTHLYSTIIKVHTDEGITGVGESPWGGDIDRIKSRVIGSDPFEIEKLVGTSILSGSTSSAVAMIESACWDIIGKTLNVPVYRLLGGRFWNRVPITITTNYESTELVTKDAVRAVEKGISTIKIKVGGNAKQDLALVRTVREAVGDDINIRVDPNQAWSVATAINNINKMAKYCPQFVEQPIPAYDLDGFKRLRGSVTVPLAVSDPSLRHTEIMSLIKKDAIDFVSSDPLRTGGLWGWKKLDAICASAGIPVVCHVNGSGVSTAVWLAATVTSPTCMYAHDINCVNIGVSHETIDDIITEPFKQENGYLQVPQGPGLGINLDEAKLKRWSNEYSELRRKGAKTHGEIFHHGPNLDLPHYYYPPIY